MQIIEVSEGRDVTESAISCNLGSGLMESMRIAPGLWKSGEYIDVVVRMQVVGISHQPVHSEDFEGPYRRIHKAKALAVAPTTSDQVGKMLDKHIAQISKHRELPGQASIDDEIEANGNVADLTGKRTAKKAAAKAAKKRHPAVKGGDMTSVKNPPVDSVT